MGRLTKAPELKYTPSNVAVATLTLAVDRNYVKQGEDREADFISCVAWRGTAEFVCKYFSKGQLIALVGSMQSRTWEDNEGKKHYITEVVADEVYFTGSKAEADKNKFIPSSEGISLEYFAERGFVPMVKLQTSDDDGLPV